MGDDGGPQTRIDLVRLAPGSEILDLGEDGRCFYGGDHHAERGRQGIDQLCSKRSRNGTKDSRIVDQALDRVPTTMR